MESIPRLIVSWQDINSIRLLPRDQWAGGGRFANRLLLDSSLAFRFFFRLKVSEQARKSDELRKYEKEAKDCLQTNASHCAPQILVPSNIKTLRSAGKMAAAPMEKNERQPKHRQKVLDRRRWRNGGGTVATSLF